MFQFSSVMDPRRQNIRVEHRLRPVAGHIAVAYDKLMLVWGGYYTTQSNREKYNSPKKLLIYDTVVEKWFSFLTTGTIPNATTGACGVIVDSTLYVFGGFNGDVYEYARLYALDLRTLVWRQIAPNSSSAVPSGRHKLVGWHYKDKLYFFGGFGPPPYHSLSQDQDPRVQFLLSNLSEFVHDENLNFMSCWNSQLISFDLQTKTWALVPLVGEAPSARAAHSSAFLSETSKVVIFGGRLQDRRMNDLYMLDLPSMTWTKIETNGGPCGRSWHSTVATDSTHIVLFGGFSQDCIPLDDSWYFDIENTRWTQFDRESIKKQRLWHTAVTINGICYVFGGCKSNILAVTTEFANDLTSIESSPKPLSQLCLQHVGQNAEMYSKKIQQLPGPLYEKLQFMTSKRRQRSIKTPTDLLRI